MCGVGTGVEVRHAGVSLAGPGVLASRVSRAGRRRRTQRHHRPRDRDQDDPSHACISFCPREGGGTWTDGIVGHGFRPCQYMRGTTTGTPPAGIGDLAAGRHRPDRLPERALPGPCRHPSGEPGGVHQSCDARSEYRQSTVGTSGRQRAADGGHRGSPRAEARELDLLFRHSHAWGTVRPQLPELRARFDSRHPRSGRGSGQGRWLCAPAADGARFQQRHPEVW